MEENLEKMTRPLLDLLGKNKRSKTHQWEFPEEEELEQQMDVKRQHE